MNEKLLEWLGPAGAYAGFLSDYLDEEIEYDESVESLEAIQRHLAGEFNIGTDIAPLMMDGIASYFGDMLIAVAGGSWDWDDATDRPLVRADGLEPVDPLRLINEVIGGAAPDALVETWKLWAEAHNQH